MANLNTYPDSITVEEAIQTRMVADLTAINNEVEALSSGNVAWTYNAKTSGYTIVASTDTYGTKVFTNNGATGAVNFSLPSGSTGYRVAFYVAAAQTLKVTANGTDKIRYKGQQTAGGGYVSSATVGTFWIMEFMHSEWVITELIGELTHAGGDFGDAYRTVTIDASMFVPPTTNGAAFGTKHGTNLSYDYYAFDGGATEEIIYVKFTMPEDWDLGTVKCKAKWSSDTGSTSGDTVQWGFALGAFSDDDTIDAALGTAQVISDTLLANDGADWQFSGATPAITVGGSPALNDTIILKCYRDTDGTDDMAEDAWLTEILIQYKSTKSPAAW